jgi:hypothetical protein
MKIFKFESDKNSFGGRRESDGDLRLFASCVRAVHQVKYLNLLKLLANRKMTMIIMINDTFKNFYETFC